MPNFRRHNTIITWGLVPPSPIYNQRHLLVQGSYKISSAEEHMPRCKTNYHLAFMELYHIALALSEQCITWTCDEIYQKHQFIIVTI
jgi:hypothetical protein